MNRTTCLTALAVLCLTATGGLASSAPPPNDTVAVMAAGGLVLQRTDGIEMRSEDLYVSAAEIRVRYRFFNRSDRPLVTLVAFPMPDIVGGLEGAQAIADPSDMPFQTTVEGRRMATNIEQKAVLNGVDHTGLLRGLELPLSPVAPATLAAIQALPTPQVEMLVDMGLVRETPGGPVPVWTLKTTHYWNQMFPARREVDIDHRYVPAVGGSAGSVMGDPGLANSPLTADYVARYCTDRDFVSAARRMRTRGQTVSETWIDYVLLPEATGAGPIGDFRMIVDKGGWKNLISFCGEDVRRVGFSTFEVRRRNYTPTRDLSVLILSSDRP
ncbi:DUF4424 family protein [Brevundimonas sp. Root1279]|uniref:DUF4424 family protein n=1 Tax=Brevundimonas sp. Root1279 TaxID=1736443 RepID=UPI0006F38C77|nr:DUF4424 family protein [Brevundimonas sp. Root1279]KQW84044.1 hypothetical protein ASC65_05355 [Brevundimonas sp. Root1279]